MASPMPPTFGATLQQFRMGVRPRLSQGRLAERAGYDHSYISRLESGTRRPTVESIKNLARGMGLDAYGRDELLIAAGFLPADVASILADEPELTDVLGILQNSAIPDDYRQSVRQVLRQIVDQSRFILREGVA